MLFVILYFLLSLELHMSMFSDNIDLEFNYTPIIYYSLFEINVTPHII